MNSRGQLREVTGGARGKFQDIETLSQAKSQRSQFDQGSNYNYQGDDLNDRAEGGMLPPIPKSRQSFQASQYNTADDNGQRDGPFSRQSNQIGPAPKIQPSVTQQNLELQQRVRELELLIIDVKAQAERKVSQLMEELPSKLDRELKKREYQDKEASRSHSMQFQMANDQVQTFKDNMNYMVEQINQRLVSVSVKVEEQEYKLSNVSRAVESLKNNQMVGSGGGSNPDYSSSLLTLAEVTTEVRLMRDQILDERGKREQAFFDQQQLVSSLQQQLHFQEQELIKRLKEHREDQLLLISQSTDEKNLLERMKQERSENDLGYVRGMLATMDKKLEEEGALRLRSEDDMRQYFEKKSLMAEEKARQEDRRALEREQRVMQQLHEGLQTVGQIVRGVKEQAAIGISEVQTMQMKNFRDLQEQLQSARESLFQKYGWIEQSTVESKQRIDELQDSTHKHATHVNEALTKEIARMEKIASVLEKYTAGQVEELRVGLKAVEDRLEQWRVGIDDQNGARIEEIHAAMKVLNGNFVKVQRDSKERFELVTKELKMHDATLKMQVGEIRKKVESDYQNLEERTYMIVDKYFQRQSASLPSGQSMPLPGSMQRLENLKDFEERLDAIKEELKLYAERQVIQNTEKLLAEKHKSDLLLEGRANAFTVDIERKFDEMFRNFTAEIRMQEAERMLKVKESGQEVKDEVSKLKSEAERRNHLFEDKEGQWKRWFENSIADQVRDLTAIVDKKMSENEVVVRKLLLKGGGEGLKGQEVRALKEKNLLEYVDTIARNLKHEIMAEVEDEKMRKNYRLDEVTRLINTHKTLLDEHITQQGESLKALVKATINEESVMRNREDERMIASANKRMDAIERILKSNMGTEVEKLVLRIETNRAEFLDTRDLHANKLQVLEEQMASTTQKIEDVTKSLNEKIENFEKDTEEKRQKQEREDEVKRVIQSMIDRIALAQEKDKEKQLKQRIDQLEVRETVTDLATRASIDSMDKKFEQSIFDIVNNLSQYVGTVNDTSAKQYQDFNANLKDSFGFNLQQIQDTIQSVSEELNQAKQVLNTLNNQVENQDINQRKALAELSDRMEVERLLSDMVSWVAEKKK